MADERDAWNGIIHSIDVTRLNLSDCLFPQNDKGMMESWIRVRGVCKIWRDIGD